MFSFWHFFIIFALLNPSFLRAADKAHFANVKDLNCSIVLTEVADLKAKFDFDVLAQEVYSIKNSAIPTIDPAQLVPSPISPKNNGGNNKGARLFVFNGKVVFAKYLPDTLSSFSQARWLTKINELGVGIKFHGVLHDENGVALIMDYVENGVETKFIDSTPGGFKIHETSISDILQTGNVLEAAGLTYAYDMQFIISLDGRHAYLIDSPFFGILPKAHTEADELKPTTEAAKIVKIIRNKLIVIP